MAVIGNAIGPAMIEALGLPPETTRIEIFIGVNEVVEVACRFCPSADGMEKVAAILKRYTLVEKPDEEGL
jgi:hypothetical protein